LDTKVCKGCGVEKGLDEFYTAARNLDGRMGKCKSCAKSSVRVNRRTRKQQYAEYERSRANLPHRIEARRKYQDEHKEEITRSKEWVENNLEKVKRSRPTIGAREELQSTEVSAILRPKSLKNPARDTATDAWVAVL